ncbi:MAG: hypothetical protein WC107_06170 [Patescibacteria group bacterium]
MSTKGRNYDMMLEDDLAEEYSVVAGKLYPEGTRVRCPRCRRVQVLSVHEIAQALAIGWPTCCGQTMRLGDRHPELVN